MHDIARNNVYGKSAVKKFLLWAWRVKIKGTSMHKIPSLSTLQYFPESSKD